MSTYVTKHRFTMRTIRHAAAALVVAGAAAAAVAAPASANPTDTVNIDTVGHTFQFGLVCSAGLAPTNATLDWDENAAQTTVRPHLVGTLCLQNTMAEVRVALTYYDNAGGVFGRYSSVPATGNGGALNAFSVDLLGPRVASAAMNHVHARLRQKIGGAWVDIPGADEHLAYP